MSKRVMDEGKKNLEVDESSRFSGIWKIWESQYEGKLLDNQPNMSLLGF